MLTLLLTGAVSTLAFGLLAGAFALASARGRALPIGCGAVHAYAVAHDLVADHDCGCGCGGAGCAETPTPERGAEIIEWPDQRQPRRRAA